MSTKPVQFVDFKFKSSVLTKFFFLNGQYLIEREHRKKAVMQHLLLPTVSQGNTGKFERKMVQSIRSHNKELFPYIPSICLTWFSLCTCLIYSDKSSLICFNFPEVKKQCKTSPCNRAGDKTKFSGGRRYLLIKPKFS